ncbi:MAG: hypothetical protein COX96_09045 [Candidatus Omnitrophica bacterium CG_4_10_14_0_2_um_filter_44_9]|nr:MAG: hypothetical protein COY78_04430 [Candidatus Omnitrophica bacterium CG_4_10_14_0_8_um_filter_44_12]PIZ83119.1 MAG: hypothetical protein COX96_09045 [Candidatus Omnitrophica bacterium CG_4_10_14_0_2_um_filter_44_9]
MAKQKHCDGFLGCRTSKQVEMALKDICSQHNRDISEVINYLCRLFIEDKEGIRSKFLVGYHPVMGMEYEKNAQE